MPDKCLPVKWWLRTLLFAGPAFVANAQPSPDLQQVIERLDRLESQNNRLELQNRELMTEIRALRQQLATQPGLQAGGVQAAAETAPAEAAPIEDRVEVQEHRLAQLDQEKISSEHRLPLTLTGMLLFNSFWTGRGGGGADNPTVAPLASGPAAAGATFRQSVVGIKFDGPDIIGKGKVTGSAYIDFFGGNGGTLTQLLRLRVASVNAAWKDTTLSFALDKPILAPREPDSLAQVGVSPLTSAGNLWLWQPQVRVEQRFHFGEDSGLRAQGGIYQTSESGTGLAGEYASSLAKSRPGLEGRFEFWRGGENQRFEVAPGFHISSTHVLGQSAPSRIFSVDWLIRPASRIDITGTFFRGENVGVVGGLRQGVTIVNGKADAVDAVGGWAQVKIRMTPRASFNLYGGQEHDWNSGLEASAISRNQTYAASLMYRFGSNVLASFESSQVRTTYVNSARRIFPHYDLAIAYLF